MTDPLVESARRRAADLVGSAQERSVTLTILADLLDALDRGQGRLTLHSPEAVRFIPEDVAVKVLPTLRRVLVRALGDAL